MQFNLNFLKLDQNKTIGPCTFQNSFQPFDQEGLEVKSLKLKVKTAATFRMQPCREGIIGPLSELLDQFVSKGVFPDRTCEFACPLVIVQKNEGDIRMLNY